VIAQVVAVYAIEAVINLLLQGRGVGGHRGVPPRKTETLCADKEDICHVARSNTKEDLPSQPGARHAAMVAGAVEYLRFMRTWKVRIKTHGPIEVTIPYVLIASPAAVVQLCIRVPGGKASVVILDVQAPAYCQLSEIAAASHSLRKLPGLAKGGQQYRHKHGYHGYYNQQLHQREGNGSPALVRFS